VFCATQPRTPSHSVRRSLNLRYQTITSHANASPKLLPQLPLSLKFKSLHRIFCEEPKKMWSGTSSSNPASPTTPQIPSSAPRSSYRLKNQGKRIAQIVKLKPEYVEKYKECHAKVWPEVLKQVSLQILIPQIRWSLTFAAQDKIVQHRRL